MRGFQRLSGLRLGLVGRATTRCMATAPPAAPATGFQHRLNSVVAFALHPLTRRVFRVTRVAALSYGLYIAGCVCCHILHIIHAGRQARTQRRRARRHAGTHPPKLCEQVPPNHSPTAPARAASCTRTQERFASDGLGWGMIHLAQPARLVLLLATHHVPPRAITANP